MKLENHDQLKVQMNPITGSRTAFKGSMITSNHSGSPYAARKTTMEKSVHIPGVLSNRVSPDRSREQIDMIEFDPIELTNVKIKGSNQEHRKYVRGKRQHSRLKDTKDLAGLI